MRKRAHHLLETCACNLHGSRASVRKLRGIWLGVKGRAPLAAAIAQLEPWGPAGMGTQALMMQRMVHEHTMPASATAWVCVRFPTTSTKVGSRAAWAREDHAPMEWWAQEELRWLSRCVRWVGWGCVCMRLYARMLAHTHA